MFDREPPMPVLDFEKMPEEDKLDYLIRLQVQYPESKHFEAKTIYSIKNEAKELIPVKLLQHILLVHEGRLNTAWYVCSWPVPLFGEKAYTECYSVPMSLLQVTPLSDPKCFPSQCVVHKVKVDFDASLETPSAKYLASILPEILKKWDYTHFNEGRSIIRLDRGVVLELTLSQALIPRMSSKHPDQARYALRGERLGEGATSEVYANPATLRIVDEGLFKKTERPRVARFTTSSKELPVFKALAEREDSLLKNIYQSLKSKPTFFKRSRENPGQILAVRFEKHLPGKQLHTGIGSDVSRWSFERRCQFAIAALRALKTQIHDRGIIHCDVKPENILVNITSQGLLEVNFIDFNLSCLKGGDVKINRMRLIGSPYYASFEIIPEKNKQCDVVYEMPQRDIYALGVTLGEVFGATLDHMGSIDDVLENTKAFEFRGLFRWMGDVSEPLKDEVRNLLLRMVAFHPNDRPDLEETAQAFEQILMKHQQVNRPSM